MRIRSSTSNVLALAGVFAGNAVDALENVEGAESNVAEIADGRGDEVEAWSERCVVRVH
jgi:hypothetical protein